MDILIEIGQGAKRSSITNLYAKAVEHRLATGIRILDDTLPVVCPLPDVQLMKVEKRHTSFA